MGAVCGHIRRRTIARLQSLIAFAPVVVSPEPHRLESGPLKILSATESYISPGPLK
jgi:hypothetical protein